MNDDKPKSIRKKSWKGSNLLGAWLIIVVASLLIVQAVILLVPGGSSILTGGKPASFFLLAAVLATVLFGAWLFVRWLCCWKNIRRSLFGVACFVTLIALFYAEEDWRGKHDWERFKRQWEAKGEHFSFASVVPPPVPADENFALTPIVASSYEALFDKNGNEVKPRNTNVVDRLWMLSWRDNPWTKKPNDSVWPEAKFVDLEAWQDFFRSTPPTNSPRADATNTFPMAPKAQSPSDDVLLALSKYNSAIAKLRQASRLPYSRFPLTYDKEPPGEILLPHLAPLKSCVQTLMLRAIAELQNGQSDQAFADVKLMLYLINSIRSEPFLISHLVRIAMLQITLQPIYDGLAEHKWSDAQLNELDSELAKLNFMADFKLAMRGEMILCQIGFFDYLRHHPKELPVMINASAGTPPILARTLLDLIPKGWFYQNQLRCARAMEGILQVANAKEEIFFPSMARKMDTTMKTERRHLNAFNLIEPLLLPTLAPAAERFAYAQESADLARMAIALERYHLAHGEYPASLDVLAPQFIKKLPHDIIGGRALHYRRTADGQFVLYSVGWNETDDGGTVAFTEGKSPRVDISEGDWVWRYPAK